MKVFVIGAGISGSLITRELSKYDVEVHLVEKAPDIGWGVTKANSAIVHGGYDDPPNSIRAMFSAEGNKLYDELARELDISFMRTGSLVVAFKEKDLEYLKELKDRGKKNKVEELEILDKKELKEKEPNISDEAIAALWCPSAGITEPWDVSMAAVENAMENGAFLHLSEKVVDIMVRKGKVSKLITNKGEYDADIIINAAGLFADEIAKMAGVADFEIFPRKGEYILLDKKLNGLINMVIFPTPTKKSKGILVVPTVDGGILLGPNAIDLSKDKKDDLSTTKEGLNEVYMKSKKLVPKVDIAYTVKTFAGLRPETKDKDFIIGPTKVWGFINVAGIRSPGLTAAPAFAKYIVEKIIPEDLRVQLMKKKDFNPYRKKIPNIKTVSLDEWEALIKKDSRFGRTVCFCNNVSEGEIVEAIRRGARTLDGVKFRTRASFGRCQGGFCSLKIMEILSRELNIPIEQVKQNYENSWIMDGKVRA
ncbi:ferredoxin [Thermosipho melanesiensis]|uniref:FAD dependent oxidoreductase n=2 Tax=Thermosipho melanesiensis TaxID=46541 RepID=A6LKN3_THEM4|nr:NAD(P)/FAD-dependent oxidoreductase [Thermosipho melanesiensis]ABR30484.1 FAD dependent oxidoreductase [Thermosipho melanesiensis BI429]APT73637.1 ferredoxin [Thermosipho melanesiensis]OOC35579.1 ferredoxin [Thermosipho melanesiensis]OOC39253.1 ferredoxin [Thermosipho melanesiensis]OOC39339.1 ferredoxin [Thermosipho melanesiensis]